jgi:hypothetical protein
MMVKNQIFKFRQTIRSGGGKKSKVLLREPSGAGGKKSCAPLIACVALLRPFRIAESIVPKTNSLPSERPHIRAHNLRRAG